MKIEALHSFHDPDYAKEWAARFQPSEERTRLFDMICERIILHQMDSAMIVELGSGPGFLAFHLLSRLPGISYLGIDYSLSMLTIARNRLKNYEDRVALKKGDLITGDWMKNLDQLPGAIVSSWTFHDLFNGSNIGRVYRHCQQNLKKNGILLNGDFIKPEGTEYAYESGRIEIMEHMALLKKAGFSSSKCLEYFETNVVHPTTANNYALIEARN